VCNSRQSGSRGGNSFFRLIVIPPQDERTLGTFVPVVIIDSTIYNYKTEEMTSAVAAASGKSFQRRGTAGTSPMAGGYETAEIMDSTIYKSQE